MNEMKRVLALLLCFVMLVGYVPAGAFAAEVDATVPSVEEIIATEATDAAEETTEASEIETSVPEETETEELYVAEEEAGSTAFNLGNINRLASTDDSYVDAALFFSDLHVDKTEYSNNKYSPIDTVFGAVAAYSGLDFSSVNSVGDAYAVNGSTWGSTEQDDGTFFNSTTAGLTAAIADALNDKTGFDMNYVWSDHDRKSDIPNESGLVYSGDNYYIYAISMADMSTNDRYKTGLFSSDDEVTQTIADFTTLVNETLDHTKPLFIVSHQPLLDRRDDNGRAAQWYPAINAAGEKMDIVFLFGHNHDHDEVSDYYWAKGQTMSVEGISKPDPLTFTHVCAGYLNPTTSDSNTRKGTAVVAEIDEDAIYLTTYDSNGVYTGNFALKNEKITRDHAAAPAPTVNTKTYEDDFTTVTATALGLTGVDVTYDERSFAQFGDNYYVALDITLMDYVGGNVEFTILPYMDEGVTADELSLFYVNGDTLEALEFTIVEEDGKSYLYFETDKTGCFVYGKLPVIIPADAELTGLRIVSEPDKKQYFPEKDTQADGNMPLAIAGLEVVADYTHEGEKYEKTLIWSEFGKYDGYDLTFDLSSPGEKTVTVSYGGKTAAFTVSVGIDSLEVSVGEEKVIFAFEKPEVTAVSVTAAPAVEDVVSALEGLLTGDLVTYSITPTYAQGLDKLSGTVSVTLPIPAGVTRPQVYYVSEDRQDVESMTITNIGEDTVTFETDHFSTFAVGEGTMDDKKEQNATVGSDSYEKVNNVYVRVDSLEAGGKYLIVNTDDNKALNNNNGTDGVADVTLMKGTVKVGNTEYDSYIQYTGTTAVWTATASHAGYTLGNNNQFLRGRNNTDMVSGTSSDWTYNAAKDSLLSNGYYIQYSGSEWSFTNTETGIHLYKAVDAQKKVSSATTYSMQAENLAFVLLNADTTTAQLSYGLLADGNALAANALPSGGKYAFDAFNIQNNIISSVSDSGVITFSGQEGTAKVKIAYSWTQDNQNYTVYKYVDVTASKPVYDLEIEEPESLMVKMAIGLNLSAKATLNGTEMEGQTITWTSSDATVATVDAGKVTGVKPGTVTISATWTDPNGVEHKQEISLTVVEHVYGLELCVPTEVKDTTDETKVYYIEVNGAFKKVDDTSDTEKTYYVMVPIVAPIVRKDVVAGNTYDNIWAVIYMDGEDIGELSDLSGLTFSSSNTNIATVEVATGLVTFTGDKGTVAVTAIYEYMQGKSVTDTVVFSVSPDHYYVPEDGTNDFPEYPNEGSVRFDKTATAVGNFSETGLAQLELSMTGVPYGRGVDVVVVIDTSSSMQKDAAGNTQTSYLSANARYAIMKQSLEDMLKTFAAEDKNGDRADIDLAIVDFNGYSDVNNEPNGNNIIPGSSLYDNSPDRNGANKGKVYTGADANKYIMPGGASNTNIGGIANLGAKHFENTGSKDFDEDRIAEILGYFKGGSSGTNYDFGIEAAYQLLSAKKADNQRKGVEREQYVIFLTDGAPFRYNGFTIDNNNGRKYMDQLLAGDYADAAAVLKDAQSRKTGMTEQVAAMYNLVNGHHLHRMAEAIKGNVGEIYWAVDSTKTTYKVDGVDTKEYLKPYEGLGAKFYAIGFCIADDYYNDPTGVVKEATSYEVIRNLSSGAGYYWEDVVNKTELSHAFDTIAKSIIDAAKDVRVEDTVGDMYTMVFGFPNAAVEEAAPNNQEFYIEVKDYTLIPVDANGNQVAADSENIADYVRGTAKSLIKLYLGQNTDDSYYAATNSTGARFADPVMSTNPIGNKRYWTTTNNNSGISILVANTTYYFAEDGNGTHNVASGAYVYGTPTTESIISSATNQSVGTNTLCENLVIATPYFCYDAATKKLVWTAEKLSTTELAISYFVYLDRSGGYSGAIGETPAATYPTNEAAYLYYRNFNGVECEREFPKPQMTWNGAQVSYVFYLVNENGQPVNRAGTVVPFSEAVYVTDVHTYSIVWNRLEQAAGLEAERLAINLVPDVYRLYDEDAAYKLHVYENENEVNLNNHFIIEGGEDVNTTYVFNTKSDVNKYRTPGTYVAYNSDNATTGKSYMCKAYEGVTVEWNTDGTIKSASYNNSAVTQVTPSSTTGADFIDASGHAYYIDEAGEVYTIVLAQNGTEVHEGFDFSNTTVAFAVVWIPKLAEDTVVVDYGLDVVIDVSANDNIVPGVVGLSNNPVNGPAMNEGFYTSPKFPNQNITVKVGGQEFADARIENNIAVRFSMKKNVGMQFTEPAVFYYEAQVTDARDTNNVGTNYMYSKVTVIPATTIYYEDDFVTLASYTKGVDGSWTRDAGDAVDENGVKLGEDGYWYTEGTVSSATQQVDRPGPDKIGEKYDADNVYGYDEAYKNCSTFSLGSAKKIHVDANSYGTAEFSFYGTGFDVISLTSNQTGVLVVQVKNASGTQVRNTMVNTYFSYGKDANGEWVTMPNGDNALYQVPVIKIQDLPYGKYEAKITATYNSYVDKTSGEDGYDLYLDAIRIYDPANNGTDNSVVEDAYVADREGWPIYEEFRNLLIEASNYEVTENPDGTVTVAGNDLNGAIFIDGNAATTSIANYVSYGPNNEVYLAKGQSVSFSVPKVDASSKIADVQIAMKSEDGTAVTVSLNVNGKSTSAQISTATDRYYSIGSYLSANNISTITFTNTGDSGILSLTNLKITFKDSSNQKTVKELVFTTAETAGWALAMLRPPVVEEIPEPTVPEETVPETTVPEETEPEVTEPEVTEPEENEPEETLDANLKVSIREKNVKIGSNVVVKATTSSDVDALTVNGKQVTHYVENRRTGVRTWNITVKAEEAGDLDIQVTAYSAKGQVLETVVEQITVTGKKANVVQQIIGSIIGVLLR